MLLSVENLQVSYGNIRALHGIDFQIDDGEIVCIIGANGAGKSTTLRAISRLVPVEEGTTMTFMGNDLLQYSADKVVSKFGISHVPEGRRLFGNLTIMENLSLATFARKDKEKIQEDLERVFSIFPRLEETKNSEIRNTERRRATNACHRKGVYERKKDHAPGRAFNGSCTFAHAKCL